MNKALLFFIIVIVLSSFVSAVTFEQTVFNGYNLVSVVGEELALFNLSGESIVETSPGMYDMCFTPQISNGSFVNIDNVSERHFYPTELNVYNQRDDMLTSASRISGKYCFSVTSPLTNMYLKFGENSAVIEGDISYNSTDNNITQETGFAHLALNNSDLLLYMPFNTNQSTTTFDYSTNDNDGTITGAVWDSTGGYNGLGAYQYNGDGDEINGILANPIMNADFTISVWFKSAHDTSGSEFIWANGGGGGPVDTELFMASNGGIRSRIDGQTIISAAGFDDLLWHHAVFVADRVGNGTMYVDGVVSGTPVNISGENDTVTQTSFVIGNRLLGTNDFNGSIDDLMVFNRTVSAAEVAAIYANASSRFFSKGTMLFDTVNNSKKTTVNITLSDCLTPFGSVLSARVNDLPEQNFTNCAITDYNISNFELDDFVNLTILFFAGNFTNPFFTPLIIGNITFDTFGTEDDPPVFTNLLEVPASPTIFNASVTNNFSVDINDNINVDTVLIDFDGTNFTATLSGLNTYFFTRTNLTAGTHNFSWFANDTNGNSNSTQLFNYTVTQSNFTLSLTSSEGQVLFSNESTIITVVGCPIQVTCTLFDPDGVVQISPYNFTMLFSGFFTFTANSTATANFSSQSATIKLEGLHKTDDGGKGNMTIAVTLMLIALTGIFLTLSFFTKQQPFTFGNESIKILFFGLGLFFLLASVSAVQTMATDIGLGSGLVGLLGVLYTALLWIVILLTLITIVMHLITVINILKRSNQIKKDGDILEELSF